MNKINSVLLVDDDEATNFISTLIIKRAGIANELLTARNGKDAIELLKNIESGDASAAGKAPNLILLDINMPVMDGFGFLQAYQKLDFPGKESVVIAVLTTSLNPRDEDLVKKAGVLDFLNKPLTGKVLEELLAKHFN
ncbi:response regulator [Pontibacter qinzhouensis]|uniref:Response regulator n=1 Tax=Pontibacter qinzhouensis TaxID=2603253 RepID=A0A5C8ITH9_9BACT|nr:response regulator [Pontibacter qinzhouensis]TXK24838.1 response regulator [Pontibacter qinzhouensis]